MGINNSSVCQFGTELSATMSPAGSGIVLIGTLTQNPVMMIFDNQGTASVQIYVNGTAAANLWRTFPGGEAITLDMRNNHGLAPNFTPPLGTTFYCVGASGVFSISFVYAQNQ
jgi:hypothetical protein